ncbi:MAG TPA: YcgL domain-containing protein, partial [Gammaproteobacteria bacterium]|nr:YcgL domain-containing protein [Gammaproteobacteria bacterium]
MRCYVYRSPRKKETYLFLSRRDDFSDLPAALLEVFGEPQFSFAFDLSSERSLV